MNSVVRLVGVEIPGKKRGIFSLSYIFGIGRSLAKKILHETNVDVDKFAGEWSDEEYNRIVNYIDKNLKVEGELRSEIMLNIRTLKDIGSYRGIRHKKGLPTRGQRTRSNARTRKGKRKTVANKKKAEK